MIWLPEVPGFALGRSSSVTLRPGSEADIAADMPAVDAWGRPARQASSLPSFQDATHQGGVTRDERRVRGGTWAPPPLTTATEV
jgi:hypothetical protein